MILHFKHSAHRPSQDSQNWLFVETGNFFGASLQSEQQLDRNPTSGQTDHRLLTDLRQGWQCWYTFPCRQRHRQGLWLGQILDTVLMVNSIVMQRHFGHQHHFFSFHCALVCSYIPQYNSTQLSLPLQGLFPRRLPPHQRASNYRVGPQDSTPERERN